MKKAAPGLILPIALPIELIREFCRRNHVTWMAFFGSVLRDDFTVQSDVDVLVTFEHNHVPGFIGLGRMEEELADVLGREVDLLTVKSLHANIRDQVLAEAQVIYDAASGRSLPAT